MKKYEHKEVKEYIESFNYKLLTTQYHNNSQLLELVCPQGHEWECNFGNFKNKGRRCSICNGNKKLFIEDIRDKLSDIGYKLISDYKNANSLIVVSCPNQHKWKTSWGKIQSGRVCPYCTGKFNNENTLRDMVEKEEGYKLISIEGQTLRDKMKVKCSENHIYLTTGINFKSGRRCPHCNKSRGEEKIMEILDRYNVSYVHDTHYFGELKGVKGGILRPDFIIEDRRVWIEYDGEFHYKDLLGYLECQQINDEIKNNYASINNWNLIRIPYWEFENLEQIIINELKLQ